jgi:hypothetical protein
MNPPLAVSLGFSLMFLACAHGCLHYFLAIESLGQRLPLRTALLPWPTRGRAVSMIALTAALAFFWFAVQIGVTPGSSDSAALLFMVLASPLLAHVGWLLHCLKRNELGWAFVPTQPSARAGILIFALPALGNGVAYLVRQLT